MKSVLVRISSIVLVMVFCSHSIAQDENSSPKRKQHFSTTKNHFSVGINDIARGCAIIHYERVFKGVFGLELGAGLTFDDLYALRYWEGDQYVKRDKPRDTRFTFSINYRIAPFQKASFIYFGAGLQYRKFYSADQDAFFQYNGYWVGSNRNELDGTIKMGNFFLLGKHFILDYYVGIGFRQQKDRWSFDHKNNLGQTYFVSGEENSLKLNPVLGLKLGVGF
jgi:hypothetical protein